MCSQDVADPHRDATAKEVVIRGPYAALQEKRERDGWRVGGISWDAPIRFLKQRLSLASARDLHAVRQRRYRCGEERARRGRPCRIMGDHAPRAPAELVLRLVPRACGGEQLQRLVADELSAALAQRFSYQD